MQKSKKSIERLKRIYSGMRQRCYNENSTSYRNYGGRGIRICDEWLDSRDSFIEWSLSHGYRNKLSIDRIDVNGNYEPINCRWATAVQQAQNRRPSSEWKQRTPKVENNYFRKSNNPYTRYKTDIEIIHRFMYLMNCITNQYNIPLTIKGFKQLLEYNIEKAWVYFYNYENYGEFVKNSVKYFEMNMNVLEALESIDGLNDDTLIKFHAIYSRMLLLGKDVLIKKKGEINFNDLEYLQNHIVRDIQVNQNSIEILLEDKVRIRREVEKDEEIILG